MAQDKDECGTADAYKRLPHDTTFYVGMSSEAHFKGWKCDFNDRSNKTCSLKLEA